MAQSPQGIDPVLVEIPTYNERENLGPIVKRLHTALPKVHVLVVDDGSPDGTGKLADELADADERVNVLHRTEKAGLGAAYVAGFRWALERDYSTIVEMDADGSHGPEDLPRMLEALDDADLVVGSRLRTGRQRRQLAQAPGTALPRREPLLTGRTRGVGQRHHRRIPGLPA